MTTLAIFLRNAIANATAIALVMPKLLLVLLFLLTGCQAHMESRVRQYGSSIPRNPREAVIFDYYEALREERYAEAYSLRFWQEDKPSSPPSEQALEDFIQFHKDYGHPLPTTISIGQETQNEKHKGEPCHYHYTVYASYPGSSVLRSGEVYLVSNPHDPVSCVIAYNSAFGS